MVNRHSKTPKICWSSHMSLMAPRGAALDTGTNMRNQHILQNPTSHISPLVLKLLLMYIFKTDQKQKGD